MKEVQGILRLYAAARAANRACALATVVRVSGSTYRRPGARMLITADGEATGCVSGGCLERLVVEHARAAIAADTPRLVTFDSTADEDIIFGLGLGCNGVIEVLVEPIPGHEPNPMDFLAECVAGNKDAVMATVFAVEGGVDVHLGDRLMLRTHRTTSSNIADEALRNAVEIDARRVLSGVSEIVSYSLPSGRADVFVERLQPPLPLVIFGAGHDAAPLVGLAKELGWNVTLVDHRPLQAAQARTLGADRVIDARPEALAEHLQLTANSAVVAMNHNYLDDLAVLEATLPARVRYLGVLGPRTRTERMLLDLRKHGVLLTDGDLSSLHAPAGLDIGADSPEQIALSIIAEIQAAVSGRTGEPLRDKSGPLHTRTREVSATVAASQSVERVPQ